jgi:uncharacterized membrane protein (UPF0127 family)
MSYAQFINKKWPISKILTPNGKEIEISWAITMGEKMQGLSDLDKKVMKSHQGLMFYYPRDEYRIFWMPSTRFDLDIIFLDKNFKIVGLEENVKHFPKRQPENKIPKTKSHYSRYVLELHAGQAKKLGLKPGSQLKWKNPKNVIKFLSNLK